MSGALRTHIRREDVAPAEERFEAFLEYEPNTGCHLFSGADRGGGYGVFWLNGQNVAAHRAAYALYCGDLNDRRVVMHSCDTPPCCNPKHLRLGSTAENQADKKLKGRALRGTRNRRARLNETAVQEIRRRCSAGENQDALAAEYGVGQSAISSVYRRTSWAWLP